MASLFDRAVKKFKHLKPRVIHDPRKKSKGQPDSTHIVVFDEFLPENVSISFFLRLKYTKLYIFVLIVILILKYQ